MPPKDKKGQNKGKAGEEDREDPLQAVVRTTDGLDGMHDADNLDSRRSLRDALQSLYTGAPKGQSPRQVCAAIY